MKNILLIFMMCYAVVIQGQNSDFIHIDQFGYLPHHTKVAIISNPEVGFNSSLAYVVGNTLEVRDAITDAVVFTGSPLVWDTGNVHSQSGDSGWWFDFSSVITPGDYYIFDPTNNESSAVFEINTNVYDKLLKTASKMFFYNRCGFVKSQPYALPGFEDTMSFAQDEFTRDVYDQNNTATTKDMRGGWFDAGDYNKYVTFASGPVHQLLWAYQENTSLFTDNFNIPESGNGIPDILDELKWELDWLLKMINTDGTVHLKMGSRNYAENSAAPPSTNTDTRYYAPTCTSATIAASGMLAHAAKVFGEIPSLNAYASILEDKAILTWNAVIDDLNNHTLEENCDDGSVVSGDADRDAQEQRQMALSTAIYLFDLTGDSSYNNYIIANSNDTLVLSNENWDNYNLESAEALLHYTTLANAHSALVNTILSSATTSSSNNYNNYFQFNELDLYRAYSNDWTYHWGSNLPKANMGNLNLLFKKHQINSTDTSTFELRAKEALHYFHGVNPLDLVYLSNMEDLGAENSITQLFHLWFNDGTDWDDSSSSLYGPAPGYLVGGANAYYNANTNLTPPYNQPLQKSYLDFNNGYPDNSWELSEPAIYYQAAYIRLLSSVILLDLDDTTLQNATEDLSTNEVTLTPNPSKDWIQIHTQNKESIKLSIFSTAGKLVYQKDNFTQEKINISHLKSGIYLVVIQSQDSTFQHTFIKK